MIDCYYARVKNIALWCIVSHMMSSGPELGVCESCVKPIPILVLSDGSTKIAPPRTECACGSTRARQLTADEAFGVVSDEAGRVSVM